MSIAPPILPEIVELIPETRTAPFANRRSESDNDHIIFCTGYLCEDPFLPQLPTVYDGFCTRNLYHNMFYITKPTLSFVAMPLKSVPSSISSSQSDSSRLVQPSLPPKRMFDEKMG